jgi:hypothetical protein
LCLCCFRLSGHKDLGDRLVECMYELTDRLAYYLCSRRPDHQIGQHYIVPELSDTVDLTEFTKAAKKKLQLVRKHHIWHYLLLSTFADWLIVVVRWKESTGITGKSSERCVIYNYFKYLPVYNVNFNVHCQISRK